MAYTKASQVWRGAMSKLTLNFIVEYSTGPEEIILKGRFAQTLDALVKAGEKGITALDIAHWAIRLSHYIYILRKDFYLQIDMVEEPHGGPFPGRHGRYTLKTKCTPIDEQVAA